MICEKYVYVKIDCTYIRNLRKLETCQKTRKLFSYSWLSIIILENIISYHNYSTSSTNDNSRGNYEVSVFQTEQGNKYQFNSSGKVAETIELVAGQTYTFSLTSSTLNHPFKLSETSDGVHAGGVAYDNGVTYTQGTEAFNFVPENIILSRVEKLG